jgi:hypothetical protein
MPDDPPSRIRTAPLSRAELGHLRWGVPPLLVLLGGNLVFDLTGPGYGRIAARLVTEDAAADAPVRSAVLSAAALGWGAFALVYLAVSIGALVVSWRILDSRVQGRARRPFLLFAFVASLLGFANLVIVDIAGLPMRAIYFVTLEALYAEPTVDRWRADVVVGVVAFINVMSVIVPALFLAAGAAAALPPVAGWNEATLARRALQVREIVAIAAAFMVAGVLHMGAWTQLAGATLGAEANAVLDTVAVPVTLFWGTTFTLMIAAFYLPLAARLSELSHEVMDALDVPTAERAKWLADRGLSFRLNQQLPQIAAVASPLLAGPLGAALGSATSALGP